MSFDRFNAIVAELSTRLIQGGRGVVSVGQLSRFLTVHDNDLEVVLQRLPVLLLGREDIGDPALLSRVFMTTYEVSPPSRTLTLLCTHVMPCKNRAATLS
jgi:hypothetical protein